MSQSKSQKNVGKKLVFGAATLGLLLGGGKVAKMMRSRDKDKQEQTTTTKTQKIKKDFIAQAMEEYYPELFAAIEYLETYRQTPIRQPSEDRCTYWNGLTWFYTVDGNGHIQQHPCIRQWKDRAAKLTREQQEEQFRLHLRFETFKKLETITSGKKHLDHKKIVGLCMAGYQLSGHMTDIANRLEAARTTQEIMDAFKYKLPVGENFRVGTLKRRWWCGAYAAGLITKDDLLGLEKDGFSKIELSDVATGVKKNKKGQTVIDHFKYDKATVANALQIARGTGKKKTVREALNESQGGRDVLAAVKSGRKMDLTALYPEAKYQTEYDAAVAEFGAGNYKSAIKKYEVMLKDFPNDGLVLNDMAAAYIELRQYDKAIDCARDVLNKSKDKGQYAAAYYNLGVAREKLGEYESALANYQAAQKNGNKTKDVKDAIARVQSLMAKSKKAHAYNAGAKMLDARTKSRNANMQNMQMRKPRTYNA